MSFCFTDAFGNLSPEEREAFYRTVFMHMDTPYAAEMRRQYYASRLRHMGENTYIGTGVTISNPDKVSLGNNVHIGDRCTLMAQSDQGITLEDGVTLVNDVYMDVAGGYIHLGKSVYLGTKCCLYGHMGLEIGDFSLLAQQITITPYSHIFEDPDRLIAEQGGNSRKVTIGRDCYLGMEVCVLYSADIGEGSVIGSGSVVVHTIPPYSVAVGVPAEVIRRRM